MTRLRIDFAFVGSAAQSAWLGSRVTAGPVDAIALMGPQQKNQVAMMASNRGFRVDREELEATEELDLIPIVFAGADGEVRVHLLVGSNAFYGIMVRDAVGATLGDVEVKVPAAEDLAILLSLSDSADAERDRTLLVSDPTFDRTAFNSKVRSIGLPELTLT